MGSNARMDPKLPSKFWDVSWPPPPTPSSKSFFTCHILNTKNYSYQIVYRCFILRGPGGGGGVFFKILSKLTL